MPTPAPNWIAALAFERPRAAALGLLTATMTFWAVNAILARATALGDLIPPFSLSFWRWLIAFAVLLPIGLPRVVRQGAVYRKHWRRLVVLALLGISTYNTCQYVALAYTTATSFAVVNSVMPVAIFLLTSALGHERASAWQSVGLAAALIGVLAVLARGEPSLLLGLEFNFGDLLVLAAVLGWAVYSVLLRGLPGGLDPLGLLTVLVFFGLFGIAPFYVWDIANGAFFRLDATNVAILVYVGTLPSVAAYFCWNVAVKLAGANLAGVSINLLPLMISALAMLFLDESLAAYHVVGLGLIFSGIYLATTGRPRPRPSARSG